MVSSTCLLMCNSFVRLEKLHHLVMLYLKYILVYVLQEVRARTDEMYHMAAVMYKAAKTEDNTLQHLEERLAQLEYENKYLREVLSLSSPVSTNEPVPQEPLLKTEDKNNETHTSTELVNAADQPSSDSDWDSRSSTPRND